LRCLFTDIAGILILRFGRMARCSLSSAVFLEASLPLVRVFSSGLSSLFGETLFLAHAEIDYTTLSASWQLENLHKWRSWGRDRVYFAHKWLRQLAYEEFFLHAMAQDTR
jgi:hypothetical protein